MWKKAKALKCCPLCGGRILVRERYAFDKEYPVRPRDGRVSQAQSGQTDPEDLEIQTAGCESCDAYWATNEFFIDQAGKFWDMKYGS